LFGFSNINDLSGFVFEKVNTGLGGDLFNFIFHHFRDSLNLNLDGIYPCSHYKLNYRFNFSPLDLEYIFIECENNTHV